MLQMTVAHVAKAVEGLCVTAYRGQVEPCTESDLEAVVTSAVTDSRQVQPGSVFVAIAGEHVDGHDFLESAAKLGARAALVSHPVDMTDEVLGRQLVQIVVTDTVHALGLLARENIALRRSSVATYGPFSVVGITGSVGKTTTKDLLNNLLSTIGPTVAPVGSFNNEIGLPLTALRVDEHTRFLVAEMGANHMGEIRYLTSLVRPDIAVVLKVGVAHVGEFGSPDNIRKAKQEIVEALDEHGVAVLNADDDRVASMAHVAPGSIIWFGVEHQHDRASQRQLVTARNITLDGHDHAHFTLIDTHGNNAELTLALSGQHHVMNALAAAAVAQYVGVSMDDIVRVLTHAGAQSAHRMDVFTKAFTLSSQQDAGRQVESDTAVCTVIDDSFNANPDSMRAGLQALAHWQDTDEQGNAIPMVRIAVLGAMLELGEHSKQLHEQIGTEVIDLGIDALIGVGEGEELSPLAKALVQGAEQEALKCNTSEAALDFERQNVIGSNSFAAHVPTIESAQHAIEEYMTKALQAQPHAHVVILLKGSHASGLGKLAEQWHHDVQTREGIMQ